MEEEDHGYPVYVGRSWNIVKPTQVTNIEVHLVVADLKRYQQKYEKEALPLKHRIDRSCYLKGKVELERLYDKLSAYADEDYYPMHMPGHKRNNKLMHMVNPYMLDITEIDSFDNLHQPEGILQQLSERLSRLYGALKSFPLVNGSTAGNLAGISAAVNRGDAVLFARNSHKSVYHAAIMMGLRPVYCYPPILSQVSINGGILAGEIEELLITHKDIKLVVITSPTYEGVVSDIRLISEIVHRHGALLMVDEAHGAHFGFHEGFPKSAVTQGADLVIQSLHKTLPAFTQTAVLHSNREDLNRKIQQYLAIYQSSSPSYLLMAGIDRCVSLLEDRGLVLFDQYEKRLQGFYRSMEQLKALKVVNWQDVMQEGVFDFDPSKLTISVRKTGLTGHQLQELLRTKYHIVMEMAAPEYVLGMTSICDTDEGLARLAEALLAIDSGMTAAEGKVIPIDQSVRKPIPVLSPQAAVEKQSELVKLSDSEDRISAAFISLYPPGTPLLVPGERIDRRLIDYIQWVMKEGFAITGLTGDRMDQIEVIQ
ncbi:MAG TPA: aminotransferase class I/II-fold pyridoxal phosphate-dependent enzyme [Mobilitalea sp.]|nr:aminotransferase class I/II-fold pyridoxal phosphate-dependent enzyme [Mobilitalea sp.]